MNNSKLMIAEMERVAYLVEQLEALPIKPDYEYSYKDSDGKWFYPDNTLYYNIQQKENSYKAELKARLTMIRKDALILRKELEEGK